jgi:hypothetical protein
VSYLLQVQIFIVRRRSKHTTSRLEEGAENINLQDFKTTYVKDIQISEKLGAGNFGVVYPFAGYLSKTLQFYWRVQCDIVFTLEGTREYGMEQQKLL